MRFPKDLINHDIYIKPNFYLCETDKTKITQLKTSETKASFKFNTCSELSFEVGRVYNDLMGGGTKVNPYYSKIEAPRLIYIDGFGYFEIQSVEIISDGIKEAKSVTAKSLEYTLSTKYLEDFYINTGGVDSKEVINATDLNKIIPVTLYNPINPKLSLLHLVLEEIHGWRIGHVDAALQTLGRQFEADRITVYDFLVNEICEKFNCYIVFDTIENTINIYAESLTYKFIGNGSTNTFTISPPFAQINTVSVDGYKTTKWEYNFVTGELVLEDAPASGARIEVVDGALTEWETDVFITFDNLSQEINVSYDADEIKTKLNVTYGDDEDIRDVNLGIPYLTDLSYFYTVDWMGQDLYDAYTVYLQKNNEKQSEYSKNAKEILDLQNDISFDQNRLSLVYGMDSSVGPETVGTYYIISGGSYPNYYYDEVSLPKDYKAGQVYYRIDNVNISEEKIHTLYSAIRKYFVQMYGQLEPEIKDIATKDGTYQELLQELTDKNEFHFVESEFNEFKNKLTSSTNQESATSAAKTFLQLLWEELGAIPLEEMFLKPYQEVQTMHIEAGYSQREGAYYWFYYPVTIMIETLNLAIAKRKSTISGLEKELSKYVNDNKQIAESLLMVNNFTEGQLIRLSAFLREDELMISDIIETDLDDVEGRLKVKQDVMESGRIELQKICQPQLQFSMTMANIYALPEFERMIDQFQLGKVIRVGLRPDYIKQSRLLQVDINFDDFSDFSCEFGELTSLRSQSDIHADLLKNAITAGKSVATNSSYWTKGSDIATATDLLIQRGLLDATTQIKSIDGTQGVVIDKYGILLQKYNPDGSVSPKQTRIVNNMILMTDDNWLTSQAGLGEFTVDELGTFYGLIAKAVIAGYIEGSTIVGGTINIGNGAFVVEENGIVHMNGAGSSLVGYATTELLDQSLKPLQDKETVVSDSRPENAQEGQLWLNTATEPYTLMVYTNGTWIQSTQQNGNSVYTSMPSDYKEGDLWVLEAGETYTTPDGVVHNQGSILQATQNNGAWTDATPDVTNTLSKVKQSFTWNPDNGLRIADATISGNTSFYVNINSSKMGFHSVEGNQDSEVVAVGIDEAKIKNATFEGNKGTIFENQAIFNQDVTIKNNVSLNGQLNIGTGFVLKRESNGSLSLAIPQ